MYLSLFMTWMWTTQRIGTQPRDRAVHLGNNLAAVFAHGRLIRELGREGFFRGRRFLQATGHSTPRWLGCSFNGSSVRRMSCFPHRGMHTSSS